MMLALAALLVTIVMVVGQGRIALALGLESDECERLAEEIGAELDAAQGAGPGRTNSILRSSKARVLEQHCNFVSAETLAAQADD